MDDSMNGRLEGRMLDGRTGVTHQGRKRELLILLLKEY